MDEAAYVVLACVRIAMGLVVCLAGYRIFRFTLPVIALLEGGYFVGMVITVLVYRWNEVQDEFWVAFLTGGTLCGIGAAINVRFGIVIVGFSGGMELATLLMGVLNYGPSEYRLVWMSLAGVIGASLTNKTKLQKPALLVAMSFVGASLLSTGMRYFVDKNIVENAFGDRANRFASGYAESVVDTDIRASWWTLTAISMVIFVTGALVQLVTTRSINHQAMMSALQSGKDARTLEEDVSENVGMYRGVTSPREGISVSHA